MSADNVRDIWITQETFLKFHAEEARKASEAGMDIRAIMVIVLMDDNLTCMTHTRARVTTRLGMLELAKTIVLDGEDLPPNEEEDS